jgi:hypothetical protein
MLVSKLSDVKSVGKAWVRELLTRVLRREGWEINDLSPLSWQLFWDFTTFGLFSKVCKFLKQNLVSRKLKYLNFGIMRCLTFLNLVFRKRRFCCRKLIVFSCLQFADCYIWSRIFFVSWCDFAFLITFTESFCFEKFPSKRHIMVLSKTCVRFRNRIFKKKVRVSLWSNYLFPCDFWVKRFEFAIMDKVLKTFPFWALTFFVCSRKLNFGI